MKCVSILIFAVVLLQSCLGDDYIINNRKFPDNFWFGCATAAFQIEGGWNADGKGESWWDNFTHQDPSPVIDGSTADVACDSYHKYETDVAMLKDLGVIHYRFSIAWSRILPNGLPESLNQLGVQYYKNLIKALRDNDIIPVVTLFHFDIPLALHEKGGLLNESFVTWFADYARICFQQFGDGVDMWTTFNEPFYACQIYLPQTGNEYICAHNVLKAHAAAYHVYDEEFRPTNRGYVSMVNAISWFGPASDSAEDIEASERKMAFDLGWWADPIYFGDYPDVMKERASERLPQFTDDEKSSLKRTNDFLVINTYASYLVKNHPYPKPSEPSRQYEESVDVLNNANYSDGAWGLLPLSRWIDKRYEKSGIFITENGLGVDVSNDTLQDDDRLNVIKHYLSAIRDAMDENILYLGYSVWSLMDNFEWTSGYSRRFGIYHVDFTSDNRTRTPKKSADWYKNVIKTKCLVDNCVN